ncbi:hypothetical protein F5X97DRAFT_345648 [Nemania serpens]|nr:hypothetical protein F5X97DRAFT_345648 [Nemania serpens]
MPQTARASRAERLVRVIEDIQHETCVERNEVISRQLLPEDYRDLLVEVDERDQDFQDFFHRDLRYEYMESILGADQFTILLPSAFRISMRKSIDHKLLCWRDDVIGNKGYSTESRTAAANIDSIRDRKMEFDWNTTLRGDCSFKYAEDHHTHPSLIFKIAWSQPEDKLEEWAMELLEEGAGQIRTVVGLDFFETFNIWDTIRDQIGNRLDPKRGPFTASVWRAVFDRDGQLVFDADDRPRVQKTSYTFCDRDGRASLTEKLQLTLRDFVPARVIKAQQWDKVKDLDDAKLELDAPTMLKYFDDALRNQKHEDEDSEHKKARMRSRGSPSSVLDNDVTSELRVLIVTRTRLLPVGIGDLGEQLSECLKVNRRVSPVFTKADGEDEDPEVDIYFAAEW